ncbi:MAG TPA: PIG-L family deacetylase [Vicinamibacterales bacterium]|nr:PIG-L family deacetylase [Vicinamibacterales bacterium]
MHTRHPLPVLALLSLCTAAALSAQVRPIYNRGAAGLTLLLGRLQTTASALHTGAHPDDEDSALIATLARDDHARVAYLALNRGEGGQNIIGTELFEALGVIRTEELLQARRLDGGEQFFTRTMDFGFSKTLEEAGTKWGRHEVLGDMVRIIRQYRPLVVASRFSGTPADGHGQHQLAGTLTPLAFTAAADPTQFSEQLAAGLRPWQARKLYVGQGFRPDPSAPPTTEIATGQLDPVIGRTYAEVAAEGRSQHKSQEMGTIELMGPQHSGLRLVTSKVGSTDVKETSLFTGIDTSLSGLASLAGLPAGTIKAELAAMAAAASEAATRYEARTPSTIVPALARGLTATRSARAAVRTSGARADAIADADFLLAFKEADFAEALAAAAAVTFDPLSNAETLSPGEAITVNVRTFVDGTGVTLGAPRVMAPEGWTVAPSTVAEPADSSPFARFFRETPTSSERFRVEAPSSAPFTEPYWLRRPRKGDLFDWPADSPMGRPFAAPLLSATIPVTVSGVSFDLTRPVEYRYADRVRGEIRRNVGVVPAVAVGLDSGLIIVPTGAGEQQRTVVVRATNLSPGAVSGTVTLQVPTGWHASPAEVPLSLKPGARGAATFVLTSPTPVPAGTFVVAAQAKVAGTHYTQDMQTIAYPHIQTHRLYSPAAAKVQAFDVTVAPVTVGYIMGSGDQVPDAIRRLGLQVTLIDNEMLATGDLALFDTIVVGVRASEARPGFVAATARLHQYMERGGTLIVQYQQGDYAERGLAPFPGQIGARVTDEHATVRILQPTHPLFTFPNTIGAADFDGWVQERNLYAFTTFDERYTPLLAAGDPNEAVNSGGELYVEVGKGRYVYTSYAWFRQLPAGVPGAYRLFANLLSLSKAPHQGPVQRGREEP